MGAEFVGRFAGRGFRATIKTARVAPPMEPSTLDLRGRRRA